VVRLIDPARGVFAEKPDVQITGMQVADAREAVPPGLQASVLYLVHMKGSLVWAVMLVALLTSCSLQKLLRPEQPQQTASDYKNPHTLCVSCHPSDSPKGTELFPTGIEPSSLCLNCHDYQENHHPVDFVPPAGWSIPFPLFEGRIRCLTCHEIHGGPGHRGTPKLLRGGPYEDRRTVCFKCHLRDQYTAIDPHKMLDDNGNVREVNGKPVCLICHSKKPNPAVDWTSDVKFRADVGFLCWRCHPPMPDPFFRTHFLVKPSPQMLERIRETEERLIVTLPLVPRGRITCSTCHNPHQKGVIQHEGPAKGADAVDRLRMPYICSACHQE
jgi:predicted CXXCH cytochrome family protein